MDPGLSLFNNPAAIINLNAIEAANANEEDEAAEDAQIKQQELKALLVDAFDDLIEDYSSDQDLESNCSSQHGDLDRRSCGKDNVEKGGAAADVQTSTPVSQNGPPALKTPIYEAATAFNYRHHGDFGIAAPEEQKRVLVNGHDGDNGLEHREWTNRITDDPVEGLPPAGITSSGLESDNEFQVNGQVMADAHGKEVSNEQNNYLMAGGEQAGPNNIIQLEILNNAKDRQIGLLNNRLQHIQDELQQEIRVLNHQLSLKHVEKEAVISSLEDSKLRVSELEQRNIQLEADLKSQQSQIKLLNESNHSMELKNQILARTVENLEAELKTLQTCDNLTKLREQHENVVKNVQERHRKELFSYSEKIDEVKMKLETKGDELAFLNNKLDEAKHEVDLVNVRKSETINKLTRSLEESQKQCKDILESDTNQELFQLRMELKKVRANSDITDNLLSSCQGEIRKLKQDLATYEKAADLGSCSSTESFGDNTMSELLSNSKKAIQGNGNDEAKLVSLLRRKLKFYVAKLKDCEQQLQGKSEAQTRNFPQDNTRCSDACVKKQHVNIEYVKQTEQEKSHSETLKIRSEYDDRILRLEEEVKHHQAENDDLKVLYIAICEEKNAVNEKLDCVTELENKLTQTLRYNQQLNDLIATLKDDGRDEKFVYLHEEMKTLINQKMQLEYELKTIGMHSPSATKTALEERTVQVGKELDKMVAQKNAVEEELQSLKTNWASELEILKYKYAQDLNAAMHKMDAERCLEQNRVVDEVKMKADDDYSNLLHEQKDILEKYHAAKRDKEELKKKVAEFDDVVARVQESFHHKLQDTVREKDQKILSLGREILSLKTSRSDTGSIPDYGLKNRESEAKIEELKLKVKKCQKYAITKEKNAHGEVVRLKTEFSITVDNMRHRMDDLIAEHRLKVQEMKDEHRRTTDDLRSQLEGRPIDADAAVVKTAYFQALSNIKNEVMKYIHEFNENSDQRLKNGLKKLALQFNLEKQLFNSDDDFAESIKPLGRAARMNFLSDKISIP